MVKKILKCRSCSGDNLINIFDFNKLPLAGSFQDTKNSGELFPLTLVKCSNCELIQTGESISKVKIFKTYSYETKTSSNLVKHLNSLAELINNIKNNANIFEIGCNDGTLLKRLNKLGHKCIGIDPSNIAKESSKKNKWNLINDFFDLKIAKRILDKYGSFDFVISTNSFAHNDEIENITKGIWNILKENGYLLIEVQNGFETLNKNQFDTIYHEHTCYFTRKSIINLLEKNKFKIIYIKNIDIHNGSIRVLAKKVLAPISQYNSFKLRDKTEDLDLKIINFQKTIIKNKQNLNKILKTEYAKGKKIVAYGASGRATILLNYYELDTDIISYIVDNSSKKINKYIPNTSIKIKNKKELLANPPDIILITAWNYQKEIIDEARSLFRFKGDFIVPLPYVTVI